MTGPQGFRTESLDVALSSCDLPITRYLPDGLPAGRVILAHGFSRGPAQMAGWAEHLASWGFEVLVPTLCHSSIFDTDHAQNGADLAALATWAGSDPVVFGGHSAGGLAALVAGSQSGDTAAVLGLDLTDAGDLAVDAAPDVSAPVFGVVGDSSFCNSSNNGLLAYAAAPDATVMRLNQSDHCDFELETDWLCTLGCPDAGGDEDRLHATLKGLVTAASFAAMGDANAAAAWWVEGGLYADEMIAAGTLSPE